MGILGGQRPESREVTPLHVEHVLALRPLRKVLAFAGRSIDDVVNCPIAKRDVLGYYKLHCWVERRMDVLELERQWNSLGLLSPPGTP